MITPLLLTLLLPAQAVGPIPPGIVERVREEFVGAGQDLGYTVEDLAPWRYPCRAPLFDDWIRDTFRFEAAARKLSVKFSSAKTCAELLAEGWTAGGHALEVLEPDPVVLEGSADRLPGSLPEPVREALALFLAQLPGCAEGWQKAVADQDLDEGPLHERALRYFQEGPDPRALDLFAWEFQREWAGAAAVRFVGAVDELAETLFRSRIPPRVETVRIPTPFGAILYGSPGKTEHTEQVLLIIDVSGDDIYRPGTAAGFGVQVFSAVIDLRGDDRYESEGEPGRVGAGAGVGGVGMVVDLRGADLYQTQRYGAGFGAFGAGVVRDVRGDDRYLGEQQCQALGLAGVGLILDEQGDDHYELFSYGQGLGEPLGAGLLIDRQGNDEYVARDDELRNPSAQTAEHNVSMAQGSGHGYRGDGNGRYASGGIGVLQDSAGDDVYSGAVFAQATGYWYGVGLLFDLAGQDRYEAVFYGQSASAHFALSYLLDAAGDDDYRTTLSQSLGNGRDFSTSIFRDQSGNDRYFAPDRSAGCGDLNGTGLFLDLDGEDDYSFHTRVNAGNANYGDPDPTNFRRTAPSYGIFLDLGQDRDRYGRDGLKDGTTWGAPGRRPGMLGVGLDDGP